MHLNTLYSNCKIISSIYLARLPVLRHLVSDGALAPEPARLVDAPPAAGLAQRGAGRLGHGALVNVGANLQVKKR